ncbi:hypothetical protein [Nonomuraea sp. NPDC049709]|uniref:hypothetical protein n=1 Tax=Nonomuraea sp. NPDC049709 TaxID=3154736 RepID=UPI00341D2800
MKRPGVRFSWSAAPLYRRLLASGRSRAAARRAGHSSRASRPTRTYSTAAPEVVLNEQAAELARRFFAPLARHLSAAIDAFTPEERQVVGRFLESGIKATAAARLEAHDGSAHDR